jgi:hypothetical protein
MPPVICLTAALAVGLLALLGADDPPSVEDFRAAYRAAHERQVSATASVRARFLAASKTMAAPAGAGEKVVAEKSEAELRRDAILARNNALPPREVTYSRSGDRQRVDVRGFDPRDGRSQVRSVVATRTASLAAGTALGADEYRMEYYFDTPEFAAREAGLGSHFVDAARVVAGQDGAEVLLGEEFEITGLRLERSEEGTGSDALLVDFRRVQPPSPSPFPVAGHVTGGTLTLDPGRDYRIDSSLIEMSNGFRVVRRAAYGHEEGPRGLVPREVVETVGRAGDSHHGVQTYTLKDVSFEPVPDEAFTPAAFGLGDIRPTKPPVRPGAGPDPPGR